MEGHSITEYLSRRIMILQKIFVKIDNCNTMLLAYKDAIVF
jgi:hypothetical protein